MSAVCPAGHTSTADDYCDVCGIPIVADGAGSAGPVAPGGSPAGSSAPGAPAAPAAPAVGSVPGGQPCPNCSTPNAMDALFCEACGYDFTTGTMPRPLTPPDGLLPPSPVSDAPEVPPSAAGAPPAPEAPEGPEAAQSSATDRGADQGAAQPDVAPGAAGAGSPPAATAATVAWVAEVWIDPSWYQAQESPDPLPSPGLPDVVALTQPSNLVGRVSKSRNIHPAVDCGTDSGVSRRQAQLTTDGSRWWVEDLDSANGTFVGPASGSLPEDPIPVGSKHELAGDDRIYVGAWTRIVIRAATGDEQTSLG